MLGVGQFGVTRSATDKATGLKYACKSIPKSHLKPKEASVIRQELQIMHHLAGGDSISICDHERAVG